MSFVAPGLQSESSSSWSQVKPASPAWLPGAAASITAISVLFCWDSAVRQASALALDVVGHNVLVEDMKLVDGLSFVPQGTYTISSMPFTPSRAYPDSINFQARVHVKNNTSRTLNIAKVVFDVYSTDSLTLHKHYVGRVTRHIPRKIQNLLHLRPGQELSSPPNAASLRIHLPYASIFDATALAPLGSASVASDQEWDLAGMSEEFVDNAMLTATEAERTLGFSLGNVEVNGEPPVEVPAPPLFLAPVVAARFAARLRRRRMAGLAV
jgi:hypothetical protein